MAKAVWQHKTLAESKHTQTVEGNIYFPIADVNMELLQGSPHTTECSWKGTANYFHVLVGDHLNENAAWIYKDPKPEAANIKGHIAFWKGVEVKA